VQRYKKREKERLFREKFVGRGRGIMGALASELMGKMGNEQILEYDSNIPHPNFLSKV
jgi:hypothetical protein